MSQALQEAYDTLRTERSRCQERIDELDVALEAIEPLLDSDVATDGPVPVRVVRKKKAAKKAKARAPKASSNGHGKVQTYGGVPVAEIAAWRKKVLAPVLKHPKGSPERTAALKALVGTTVTGPDGEPKVLGQSALYLWLQQA